MKIIRITKIFAWLLVYSFTLILFSGSTGGCTSQSSNNGSNNQTQKGSTPSPESSAPRSSGRSVPKSSSTSQIDLEEKTQKKSNSSEKSVDTNNKSTNKVAENKPSEPKVMKKIKIEDVKKNGQPKAIKISAEKEPAIVKNILKNDAPIIYPKVDQNAQEQKVMAAKVADNKEIVAAQPQKISVKKYKFTDEFFKTPEKKAIKKDLPKGPQNAEEIKNALNRYAPGYDDTVFSKAEPLSISGRFLSACGNNNETYYNGKEFFNQNPGGFSEGLAEETESQLREIFDDLEKSDATISDARKKAAVEIITTEGFRFCIPGIVRAINEAYLVLHPLTTYPNQVRALLEQIKEQVLSGYIIEKHKESISQEIMDDWHQAHLQFPHVLNAYIFLVGKELGLNENRINIANQDPKRIKTQDAYKIVKNAKLVIEIKELIQARIEDFIEKVVEETNQYSASLTSPIVYDGFMQWVTENNGLDELVYWFGMNDSVKEDCLKYLNSKGFKGWTNIQEDDVERLPKCPGEKIEPWDGTTAAVIYRETAAEILKILKLVEEN